MLLVGRGRARAARPRHGEDAAVRQQERAAGRRPHAGGHAARDDRRRRVGAGRRGAARCGGHQRAELRRHVVAVHVQRPRPALLPAARAQPGRPAGDARRQGRRGASRVTRSRSGSARGSTPVAARLGATHPGRRGAAGSARCCRRWSPRSTVPTRRAGSSWRARSARRSRRRRASSMSTGTWNRAQPKLAARRRRREGRRRRSLGRGVRVGRAAWPAPACRPGCCTTRSAREDVPIVLRLPRELRGSLDAIRATPASAAGRPSPSASSRAPVASDEDASVYHKNLLPVTYVTGDVAGRDREPGLRDPADEPRARRRPRCPKGYGLEIFNTQQPFDSSKYAMKWDGEWHITYEVFRDLGHRVRRRADPDLHPRRRLVPVVRDAVHDHAGDSVLARRHPAGARARWARSSPRRR